MHYYINHRSLSKSVSQEVNSARTCTGLILYHFIYHLAVVMEQILNVNTITMILNSKPFISVNGDNNSKHNLWFTSSYLKALTTSVTKHHSSAAIFTEVQK